MERPIPFAKKTAPRYINPMDGEEHPEGLIDFEAAKQRFELKTKLPQKIEGREKRANKLASLPKRGFELGQTDVSWATERILDVGLPVDNFKLITLEQNVKGREDVLGSWGIGSENYGTYSIYELLARQIPEKQLGTIAHESAHANTPFNRENAFLFGSEEARAEAAQFAEAAAQQTIDSERFLNNYHKNLYLRMIAGIISRETFNEETWAITTELALTNRKKLEQVQVSQHASIENRIREGLLHTNYKKTNFISTEDTNGKVTATGVDKALINLIDGVNDYNGLIDHVDGLKAKFYPQTSLAMAA